MEKDRLLKRFFQLYRRFSFYENQVSFIEGRNYYLIFAFYDVLVNIKTKYNISAGEIARDLTDLEKGINIFIAECQNKYPFVVSYNENAEFNEKVIIEKFNSEVSDYFDEFVIAYNHLMNYKDGLLLEELLIEINNFLSHFVNFVTKDYFSSGKSHLCRGALDGYKEIIYNENKVLIAHADLIKDLVAIRINELQNIGNMTNENSCIDVIGSYKNIGITILQLINSLK